MSKNEDSLDILLDNFVNKPSVKNLYVRVFHFALTFPEKLHK